MAGKMAAEDWFLFRCLFMAQIKLHTTRTFNYLEYVELPVRVSLTLSLSLSFSLSLSLSFCHRDLFNSIFSLLYECL